MDTPAAPPATFKTPEQLARRHARWTYADLALLPETHDRIELIDGDLVLSPSPHATRHQRTVMNLASLMRAWTRAKRYGLVFIAPVDVVLTDRRVVQPDVCMLRQDRLGLVGRAIEGAPDVVVQVLSPSNAHFDRTVKVRLYEDEGVLECWLVDPDARTVEVLVLDEVHGYRKHAAGGQGDTVASAVMAGFSVDVSAVFEDVR